MKLKLNWLIVVVVVAFFPGFARADMPQGRNALLANLGFSRGGTDLGLDYEYGYARTYGLGGYFRIDPDGTNPKTDGITAFGVFIRPHFSRQNWDFYVSPGFGLISYKAQVASTSSYTYIGPELGIGLLYELSPNLSAGVEQSTYYGWFGKADYRGLQETDLAAKLRFIF